MSLDDEDPRGETPAPYRPVTRAEPILDGTRSATWMFLLGCGHTVYRPAKWINRPAVIPARNPRIDELHPPQARARCEACRREAAGLPPLIDPKLSPEMADFIGSVIPHLSKSPGGILVVGIGPSAACPDGPGCPVHGPLHNKPAPAHPHGTVGVTVHGVHVALCPDCRGQKTVCPNCHATGTIPPAMPSELREDYILGYWFACNSIFDTFSTIACRPWGWVGMARVTHHHVPKQRVSVFRPPTPYSADQVIECHNRCEDEALMDDADIIPKIPGSDPEARRWRVFVDVRSNEPKLLERRWDSFVAACGGHLRP